MSAWILVIRAILSCLNIEAYDDIGVFIAVCIAIYKRDIKHAFYVPASMVWPGIVLIPLADIGYKRLKITLQRSHPIVLTGDVPNADSLDNLGRAINAEIRSLNAMDFIRVKNHDVPRTKEKTHVSRGTSRLKEILNHCGWTDLGCVVEAGVGRGGFLQYIDQFCTTSSYHGYSRWNQPGQEDLAYKPKRVKFTAHSTDMKDVVPYKCDTFISDMGENQETYDEQITQTTKIMRIVSSWIKYKPSRVIVRLPNVLNDSVVDSLVIWKQSLGGGELIRVSDERNSVATIYFVNHCDKDIRSQANELADKLIHRITEGLKVAQPPVRRGDVQEVGIKAVWPEPNGVTAPKLDMLDMSKTVAAHGVLRKPIGTTFFLKEIGWYPSTFMGTAGTYRNPIVTYFINPISELLEDFGLWQATSTRSEATYKTVKNKIDVAPVENHQHHAMIHACYQAISRYLRKKGCAMRRLTDNEIVDGVNKDGAMGWQERNLGFSNIGQYITRPDIWKAREAEFRKNLMNNKPINGDYNSIGKRERKQKDSSRLIWFLCATARIYETRVLGHIDNILKKLPTSVSGMPLYDYGMRLSRMMQGKHAVCDDIAGWDTKISYSLLCEEADFLCSLTDDEGLRKEIRQLYRLYAYPMVNITRPGPQGVTQNVLYQLQGQVASGRRVTYAMNTITNTVATMCKLAYSLGVTDYAAFFDRVLSDKTLYEACISGDDSVVALQPKVAKVYAEKGFRFTNDIGMVRKDLDYNAPSMIHTSMDTVEFCSHQYVLLDFKKNGEPAVRRWMPIRSITEILAKASIMIRRQGDEEYCKAWARTQALNMYVNYFHIATVRNIAKAVLSATPSNITLDGTKSGWSYRNQPWITEGDPLSIVNQCLFKESTLYPQDYECEKDEDLPLLSPRLRKTWDTAFRTKKYSLWKKQLYAMVQRIRNSRDKYDDWITNPDNEGIM